jgi:hypothetical protein
MSLGKRTRGVAQTRLYAVHFQLPFEREDKKSKYSAQFLQKRHEMPNETRISRTFATGVPESWASLLTRTLRERKEEYITSRAPAAAVVGREKPLY